MKTTEDYIKEMERDNVLMNHECTFPEYVSQIMQFQSIVCKMIAGDAYHKNMRMDEAQFIMESTARRKALQNHPAVQRGALTMKKLVKEAAITISGAKGESIVSRTLEFLNRPNTQIFRNVYITDGNEETELDAIVLTNNGVIILEMKKVKSDFTLTEDGRMVFSSDECFDKIPLGEKMAIKRRLLMKHLEQLIEEKELDIPVHVDSFIVFCAPKGQYIRISDNYHREKHCFRTCLNKKIESYQSSVNYREDQMEQLGVIFSEMQSNVKRFETKLNYDEVRRSLAEAMVVLQDAPVAKNVLVTEETPAAKTSDCKNKSRELAPRAVSIAGRLGYVAASVFAGVLASGAVAILSASARRV